MIGQEALAVGMMATTVFTASPLPSPEAYGVQDWAQPTQQFTAEAPSTVFTFSLEYAPTYKPPELSPAVKDNVQLLARYAICAYGHSPMDTVIVFQGSASSEGDPARNYHLAEARGRQLEREMSQDLGGQRGHFDLQRWTPRVSPWWALASAVKGLPGGSHPERLVAQWNAGRLPPNSPASDVLEEHVGGERNVRVAIYGNTNTDPQARTQEDLPCYFILNRMVRR